MDYRVFCRNYSPHLNILSRYFITIVIYLILEDGQARIFRRLVTRDRFSYSEIETVTGLLTPNDRPCCVKDISIE